MLDTSISHSSPEEELEAAQTLHEHALLSYQQGNYPEVEAHTLRVLAIRERVAGADTPVLSDTLNLLAQLYQERGKYADAEALLRRALSIDERTVGEEHPDTAVSSDSTRTPAGSRGRAFERQAVASTMPRLGDQHMRPRASLHLLFYQARIAKENATFDSGVSCEHMHLIQGLLSEQ